MKGNWWRVARCRKCRKEIVVRDDWAYKVPNGTKTAYWFCSWACLQDWRNGQTRKTKRRGLKDGEKV